ncbi:hypothetical protein E1B28_006674 [Marasmius oreades]|uniref:Fungal-type protein kinase domain-containing protein n=1 Tax=Marasmius oreades TaxID=181124 RepID=A0A9P7UWK6_9AGAR|nr:uncharacterized protein E1B28_006674 [Marasmius oreades]KAG7095991.1 hypothetical protein E1B28_006674 [Marasmius oreades]
MPMVSQLPVLTPNGLASNQEPVPGTPTLCPATLLSPPSVPKAKATPAHMRPNRHATSPVVLSFEKRKEVAFFTNGRYIGGLRVEEFLSTFLPYHHPNARHLKPRKERLDLMRSVASQQSEAGMYEPFVQALENWPPRDLDRKIKLVYKDCHLAGDPNCGGLSVDIPVGTYSTRRLWEDKCYIPFSEQESHVKIKFCDSSDPFCDRQMRQRNVQLQGEDEQEYEAGMDDDQCVGGDLGNVDNPSPLPDCGPMPTEDEPEDGTEAGQKGSVQSRHHLFENMTSKGISCRGQIAYYAAALLTVQYRVFFFQLVIFGRYARFVRWDRSCAIVSERFSYTEEPEHIFDFYHRLAQLDATNRGYDPSIAMVSKEEAGLARAEFKKFSPNAWHGRSQLPHKLRRTIQQQPFRSVEMLDRSRYIICVPVFHPDTYTPFGRCTRRSLAFNPDTGSVHFYKDYQSQNYAATLKEAEVYERINDKRRIGEVPRGLCTMISGGDVPNTKTIGHEYWKEEWVYGTVIEPIQLITHRIVLKEVGASIKAFTNIKTLLTCAADAMEAHTWLVHELRLLHRDISPGNILMEREADEYHVRRGFLIDFDHALDLTRVDPLHPPGRSGTFLFFAAALFSDSQVVQSEKDDRESLFHSIVYLGLLHAQHSLSNDPVTLEQTLQCMFETAGFYAKAGAFVMRAYSNIRWANPGLQKFVEELELVFASRYYHRWPADQANLIHLDTRSWMDKKIRDILQTMPPPPEREFINNDHYPPATTPAMKRALYTYENQDTENRLGFDGRLDKLAEER